MRSPFIPVLFGLLILFLSSCQKGENNVAKPDRDHTAALDNYRAEFYFADALKQSDTPSRMVRGTAYNR